MIKVINKYFTARLTKYAPIIIIGSLFIFSNTVIAESNRIVHWWNQYLPTDGDFSSGVYNEKKILHYQDVNNDNIYNDTVIFYGVGLDVPMNPLSKKDTGKDHHLYRADLPSAKFYGRVIGRFANVSDITKEDRNGNRVPLFTRFQQDTVQGRDGAKPCSYVSTRPHNLARAWILEQSWSDMTVMPIGEGGACCPISDAFHKADDALVNFTALFLWKKENFINGGESINNVTLDENSKISVDITRFRKNIQEGRYVIQDGTQLWISEATVTDNQGKNLSIGMDGMTVEDLSGGAIATLNPLRSRWAVYNPFVGVDENEVDRLSTFIKRTNFDPKNSSPEDQQQYIQTSEELLSQINKVDFNRNSADFIDHTFKDVQAVGVYFASYIFEHKVTRLVFDNFQFYATGIVPAINATTVNKTTLPNEMSRDTQISAEMSVNCGSFQQSMTACIPDRVDFRTKIDVAEEEVGQSVDLLLLAGCKQNSEATEEIFYFLNGQNGQFEEWDRTLQGIIPFRKNVILSKQTVFETGGTLSDIFAGTNLCGNLAIPVQLRLFFGYRNQQGAIVYRDKSIDMNIFRENTDVSNRGDSINELPYSETIQGLCM